MKKSFLAFLTLLFFAVNINAKEIDKAPLMEEEFGLTCADVAWDFAARNASYGTSAFWIAYGYANTLCEQANQ